MNIKEEEITYSYSSIGYTMFFRAERIGGAGVHLFSSYQKKPTRMKVRSNCNLFHQQAEREKKQILNICNGNSETYDFWKQFAPFCHIERIIRKEEEN